MSKLILIAGSCVVESKEISDTIAKEVSDICKSLDIEYVYKGSFKKANRSKISSFSGLDFKEAMSILDFVRQKYNVETLTDVHETTDCIAVSNYVNWLQIPSFLMRQTSLLVAAGETNKKINIKKFQGATAQSAKFAVDKVRSTGNNKIWLTERGAFHGLSEYVVDFRNIKIMQSHGVPAVLDATHAMQIPNTEGGVSGGTPEYIPMMAKLGIIAGIDSLFLEVHPNPEQALSDASTSLKLDKVGKLLEECMKIRSLMETF